MEEAITATVQAEEDAVAEISIREEEAEMATAVKEGEDEIILAGVIEVTIFSNNRRGLAMMTTTVAIITRMMAITTNRMSRAPT